MAPHAVDTWIFRHRGRSRRELTDADLSERETHAQLRGIAAHVKRLLPRAADSPEVLEAWRRIDESLKRLLV